MTRIVWLIVFAVMCGSMVFSSTDASAFFVATAQNFRGALYQGFGPTPGHASEMALVKCTQNSFAPRSCRVFEVRLECPPPPPPLRKPMSKTRISYDSPQGPPWASPMR